MASLHNRFQFNSTGFIERATNDLAAVYQARRLPRELRPDAWRIESVEKRVLADLAGLVWC